MIFNQIILFIHICPPEIYMLERSYGSDSNSDKEIKILNGSEYRCSLPDNKNLSVGIELKDYIELFFSFDEITH